MCPRRGQRADRSQFAATGEDALDPATRRAEGAHCRRVGRARRGGEGEERGRAGRDGVQVNLVHHRFTGRHDPCRNMHTQGCLRAQHRQPELPLQQLGSERWVFSLLIGALHVQLQYKKFLDLLIA